MVLLVILLVILLVLLLVLALLGQLELVDGVLLDELGESLGGGGGGEG